MYSKKTYNTVILAIFTAIIIIQTIVPFLGYLPIPPINPTIIHITIIIGAIVLGPKMGATLGLIWGITCVIKAFVAPYSPIDTMVFTNPFVSVLPRICVGLFAGYTFKFLDKMFEGKKFLLSTSITAFVGSFTNTILVLSAIYIFERVDYAEAMGVAVNELIPMFMAIIGTNGVVEAILAIIVTPIIVKPLLQFRKKFN